jgi:outer membrane protein OmpA-like peptidoglycan-associated protein
MKNINVKFLVVLLVSAAFFSSCGLNKMIRDYGDNITYTSQVNPLENHGGEVAVNVNGRVSDRYFHRRAKLELTPVLKFEGGEKEMGTYILRGDRTSGQGTMVNRGSDTNISMTETIAFEEGMQESELVIRARVYREGREDAFVNLPDRKVADGVINTSQRVDKGQDLAIAPHGYEKVTTVTESANIYFEYMRHNLNWRLPLNRKDESQQKIEDLKEFLKRQWEIQSIEVNAWASPEGEVAFNEKLSENRAKTVEGYVNNLFRTLQRELGEDIERPDLKVTAKGEDFEGFMEVLNASDLRDKQAISNVINSQLAPAERERRIKDMTVIYAEIEKLLEPLRRGEIVVTLYEPKKTDEEIAMLSTSDPSQLDVKELLYAATLTEDLQTQLAIYKSAQQLFPQDFRGFNNAAYVYLKMENGEEAAKELERANQIAPNMGCVLNNLGVVATWERDIENAQSYFEAAQAKGMRVNYNIGNLMILKGDYQAALSSFAGRTCTHNIALAHLLAGNESAAMTNLDCAPESAQVAYLKAVIGARRENNTMVFQNLRRAVQLDPAYKEEAQKDREFIRYFNVAEFQEIVR